MRFDIQNQFSVNQAFTATAVSTNAYDTQTAAADPTIGERLAVVVYPKVAAAGGATYALQAIQADDAALTTNVEVLGQLTGVADASLVKGREIEIPIPQGVKTRRYLGFKVVMTGGTTPTVTLDAYLMPQSNLAKDKRFPKLYGSDE
jgi:mRNA-degrading endonuclease toxin of MazEF toxin-antitoxin module